MPHEKAFAEQHLGEWQGMNRKAFVASLPPDRHWLTTVDEPAPGGESFMDLYNRTCGAIERITREQAGRDVIAVTHGGTIRAAVGLALGGQPEKGLAFDIDNCSVTRLDHIASGSHAVLAAADGQPAAMDRGCLAQRDASAGGAGGRAGDEARLSQGQARLISSDPSVVENRKGCLVRDLKNQSRRNAGSTSGRET